MNKAKTVAWVSTGVAVLLASAPGLYEVIVNRRLGGYDAPTAVLTATLIALIWTTYHTVIGIRQQATRDTDEKTRRTTEAGVLAVGVSVELASLEKALDFIEQQVYMPDQTIIDHPQIDHALTRPGLMPQGIFGSLSRLDSTLQRMKSSLALFAADLSTAYRTSAPELTRYAQGYNGVVSTNEIRGLVNNARQHIENARTALSQGDRATLELHQAVAQMVRRDATNL